MFRRLEQQPGAQVAIVVDGARIVACEGDNLAAVLDVGLNPFEPAFDLCKQILLLFAYPVLEPQTNGIQQVTRNKAHGMQAVIDLVAEAVGHRPDRGHLLGLKQLDMGTLHVLIELRVLNGQRGLIGQDGEDGEVVICVEFS